MEKSSKSVKKDAKADALAEVLHEEDGVQDQAEQVLSSERLVTDITKCRSKWGRNPSIRNRRQTSIDQIKANEHA